MDREALEVLAVAGSGPPVEAAQAVQRALAVEREEVVAAEQAAPAAEEMAAAEARTRGQALFAVAACAPPTRSAVVHLSVESV